jgi:H+-translocating NAD(P) transhydrogenase subunit alpha
MFSLLIFPAHIFLRTVRLLRGERRHKRWNRRGHSASEDSRKLRLLPKAMQVNRGSPPRPRPVKKIVGLGADVAVEPGAGLKSGILDADFSAAGAAVAAGAVNGADTVLRVRRPSAAELSRLRRGAIVIAIMDPYGHVEALNAIAEAGITSFAMELLPRITRAQVMDVLSSQANLAGYRAVIDAAEYGRALPMMMTAAGTVSATKVFVMGGGVAGLQAIATARRLGAVVTATDVRLAAKEQVKSLGAKFIAVEDEEFKAAETAGGYAVAIMTCLA